MTNRSGSDFTNTTIQHMLKNIAYTGVLKSGEIFSEPFAQLQIIEARTFEKVQEMLKMRSIEYSELRRIPLNTKGMVLLSGNVFCGHCGARLVTTTNGKIYVDGVATPKIRYVCYNRSRHPGICNGQTGYTSKKLDGLIERIVMNIFDQLKDQPKEEMVKARYMTSLEEQETKMVEAKKELTKSMKEQSEYEAEVINIIRGTSQLSSELVNKLHGDATQKVAQYKALVMQCEEETEKCRSGYSSFQQDIDDMLSWASIFSTSSIEEKKMIVSNLISCVRVCKNYKLEVTLNVSCGQMNIAASTQVANATVYWA